MIPKYCLDFTAYEYILVRNTFFVLLLYSTRCAYTQTDLVVKLYQNLFNFFVLFKLDFFCFKTDYETKS
jgi:hypothetical protein